MSIEPIKKGDITTDKPYEVKFDRDETVWEKRQDFVKAFQEYKRQVLDLRLLETDIGTRNSLKRKYNLFLTFISSGDTIESFNIHALRAGFNFDKAAEYVVELNQVIIPDFKIWLRNGIPKQTQEGEFRI